MSSLMLLLEGPVPRAIGWSLIHHLWQATLIALIAAAGLGLMRRQSASARYLVACASLALMILFPLATAFRVYVPAIPFTSMESSAEPVQPPASTADLSRSGSAIEPLPLLTRARQLAIPFLPTVVFAWFVGVTILSVRLLAGWIHMRRLCLSGQPVLAAWIPALQRLARLLQLRRGVRLLESSYIEVPMVIGWLRPVILVPATALTGLSAQQLETILAHELAHIRRHDYLVNLAQTLAETLFFYHPAVWWISARIRAERENCCDDLAVAVCGNPVLYARALANLEGLRAEAHAVAANGATLRERVLRLVSVPPTHCSYWWVAGVSILTLLAAVAIAAPITLLSQEPTERAVERPEAAVIGAIEPQAVVEPQAIVELVAREVQPKLEDPTAAPEEYEVPGSEIEIRPGIGVTIRSIAGVAPRATTFTLLPTAKIAALTVAEQVAPAPPTRRGKHASKRWNGELTIDQLIALKEAGVDAKYIGDLRALGYGDLSFEELIELRQQGVDPEYIAQMNKIGHGHLAVEQLVELRNNGVSPAYVEEMTRAGLGKFTVEEIMEARTHGVSGAFVEALREAGLENLSMNDILRLHMSGITIEFVRELKQNKKKNVSSIPESSEQTAFQTPS